MAALFKILFMNGCRLVKTFFQGLIYILSRNLFKKYLHRFRDDEIALLACKYHVLSAFKAG